MQISQDYFKGEDRSGYYVQPIMKRVWAAQLEVLAEIDRICKKHNLKYFAQWGTLLGAVRHQGFIPWDDDMDIAMLRDDFEKFRRISKHEVPDGWRIADYNSDDYNELMIRVINSTEIRLDQEYLERFHYCPYVVGIDVFCMDRIPVNKGEEELLLKLLAVADIMGVDWDNKDMEVEEKFKIVRDLEELTGFHFSEDRSLKKQLLYLADRLCASYWDSESKEVTMMYKLVGDSDYRIPLTCFDEIIEVPFEYTTIPIPKEYDLLLKCNYGADYMTPIRGGAGHDYPFFKNQIEKLRNFFEDYNRTLPAGFDFIQDNNSEEDK